MVQHRDRERTSTRRETETGRQRQLGKENQYREIDKREREKNSYLHRYKQVDGQRERERERQPASQIDGEIIVRRKFTSGAGAMVQWLREETHVLKVVGSNPSTVYWMDIFSHTFVVKIVMFV